VYKAFSPDQAKANLRKYDIMKDVREEQLKTKIIEIFDKYLGEEYLLFLFGSFSKKTSDITSDIDLAVYCNHTISPLLLLKIKEELEHRLYTLKEIDLINLTDASVNKNLLENILKEGVLWKKSKN